MNRPLIDDQKFDAWVRARTPAGRWADPPSWSDGRILGLPGLRFRQRADHSTWTGAFWLRCDGARWILVSGVEGRLANGRRVTAVALGAAMDRVRVLVMGPGLLRKALAQRKCILLGMRGGGGRRQAPGPPRLGGTRSSRFRRRDAFTTIAEGLERAGARAVVVALPEMLATRRRSWPRSAGGCTCSPRSLWL